MRNGERILPVPALLASIWILATPAAQAQCAPAQVFGSTGLAMLGMVQVEIEGGVSGNEIGRFWNAGNSAFANNFAGTCPASGWIVPRNSGDRGVSGAISGTGCIASSCPGPDDEMIWLIEDRWPTDPPALGTAGFIGFRMDATPGAARYWDLARAAGNVPATLPLLPFPQVLPTSILVWASNWELTFDLEDAGIGFWGENAGGPIPDTASIVSYDICIHVSEQGNPDLGRERAGWDCPYTIPYDGGPSTDNVVHYFCQSWENVAIAVGITFDGGGGGNVQSELVGEAWTMDCFNILADPDSVPEVQERPHFQPRPRRTR